MSQHTGVAAKISLKRSGLTISILLPLALFMATPIALSEGLLPFLAAPFAFLHVPGGLPLSYFSVLPHHCCPTRLDNQQKRLANMSLTGNSTVTTSTFVG